MDDGFECEIDCIRLPPPLAAGIGWVQRSGLYSLDYRSLSNKHVFVAKTFSTAKYVAMVCTYDRNPAFPPVSLSQSPRENKAASHVLQTVWSYKDLRNALTKEGWNKSHFQVHGRTCMRAHAHTHIHTPTISTLMCPYSLPLSLQQAAPLKQPRTANQATTTLPCP